MTKTIQAIRGMNDILPEVAHQWEFFEDTVREWLAAYGYRNIRMPLVEQTDLFVRSIGEVTDIVEKEMYTFVDHLNNDSLTLRPEGTASCVRAVLEHNLLYAGPQRLYYSGPMFRHERPQKAATASFIKWAWRHWDTTVRMLMPSTLSCAQDYGTSWEFPVCVWKLAR